MDTVNLKKVRERIKNNKQSLTKISIPVDAELKAKIEKLKAFAGARDTTAFVRAVFEQMYDETFIQPKAPN